MNAKLDNIYDCVLYYPVRTSAFQNNSGGVERTTNHYRFRFG